MSRINNEIVLSGIVIDESTTFSLIEVCEEYEIEDALLREMIEYSLIEPQRIEGKFFLDLNGMRRVRKALHLQRDLDINLQGVVLVLDLLDELERVRHELMVLHRHLE